jgi:hypothetical protein
MIRLFALVAGAFAFTQTAPAERIADDVRDLRERQYLTGQHAGCQLQLARAVVDQDLDVAATVAERCERLERRRARL